MNKEHRFSFIARRRSLYYAWSGLKTFIKTEHNARLHLLSTFLVIIAIIILPVTIPEIIALVIVTGLVWMAELFNSAIEKMMDFISCEKCDQIGYIKDVSAGAVLILCFVAVITALLIFIPKLLQL